jgi:Fic family protein
MPEAFFSSRMSGYEGPLDEPAEHYTRLDILKKRLDALRPMPPQAVKSLRDDMVLRYTYHSNALEGNTLTLHETKVVLEDGITIGGKSMREHLEAVNHREAIVFLEELAETGSALTERSLKELHGLILRGIDDESAGRYRRRNVIISGASTRPPEFLHVQEHMDAFFQWCSHAAPGLHPVERAARVHADFVNIHPFADGNGRTARLIMNLELLRSGFPVVIIPVEERSTYYTNLDRIAARGDYLPFVERVCALVEKSFEPYWFVLGNDEERHE